MQLQKFIAGAGLGKRIGFHGRCHAMLQTGRESPRHKTLLGNALALCNAPPPLNGREVPFGDHNGILGERRVQKIIFTAMDGGKVVEAAKREGWKLAW